MNGLLINWLASLYYCDEQSKIFVEKSNTLTPDATHTRLIRRRVYLVERSVYVPFVCSSFFRSLFLTHEKKGETHETKMNFEIVFVNKSQKSIFKNKLLNALRKYSVFNDEHTLKRAHQHKRLLYWTWHYITINEYGNVVCHVRKKKVYLHPHFATRINHSVCE